MTHEQLEHIIRAAATISGDDDIVVIGSQAVLGSVLDPPAELVVSTEADIFPRHRPELADLIDGSIGEGSPFHETFGYYAHGVGPETAILPAGWTDRLVPFASAATRGATGWCLELHDLLISKYVAGREKDRWFTKAAVAAQLALRDVLEARLATTSLDPERLAVAASAISRDFGQVEGQR